MHWLQFAEVDYNIQVFKQALPLMVGISPAAKLAISERGGAMRWPCFAERLTISDFASFSKMLYRLQTFAAIAIFVR